MRVKKNARESEKRKWELDSIVESDRFFAET